MIDDERPDAPQEGDAPEGAAGEAGDESQPTPSADPSESPAAGDEPLTGVEDESEEISEAPDAAADESGEEPAPEPAAEEPAPEPAAEEPAPEPAGEEPAPQPAAEEPAPEPAAEEPAAEPPAPEEPAAASEEAAGDQPPEPDRPRRERRERGEEEKKEEVVPGAHLEPDLVLDQARAEAEVDEYADRYGPAGEEQEAAADGEAPPATAAAPTETPAPRSALDLAADARYLATGKRKTSVARVILRPGDGAYSVNGRSLEDYFPRAALQKAARQPLQTAGFEKRMDVVAKIHGGGVSAQAGALRHGVARALVEADPSLRADLKRRGFLSRDARAKERKKAGLKKARKRPQFSKR